MSKDLRLRSAARIPAFVGPISVTLIVVGLAYVFGAVPLHKVARAYQRSKLHWPDIDIVAEASPAVHVHLAAAVVALLLGGLQFFLPKGTKNHRAAGYLWLSLMLIAALSSFSLRNINPGQFSLIHFFALLTLIAVPRIIWLARQGRIAEHRKAAVSLYIGGLVVAGALAFLPGRLMWTAFFN